MRGVTVAEGPVPREPFMVAQLGARMHYAVPRILHGTNRLSRLVTDVCASRGWIRALRYWPERWRPGGLRRLLSRVPHGVPRRLIRANARLGLAYARQNAKTRTHVDRINLFLRVGKQFGEWTVGQDWGGAGAVFVYNTAGLEILREARRRRLVTVMEQTIAPSAFEQKLLSEECARFPRWETPMEDSPVLTEYAERERQEWELADLILCGSEFVREGIAATGGPSDRAVVLPYGVDARFQALRRESHDGPLRVLCVGLVGLRKGVPYAIEVAKRMRGRALVRWVGAFTITPEARAEFGPDVEFVGPIARSEMAQQYAWADVFYLPSLCEGSATSTYEALMSGLPIVCTPNTGSVIRDGVEGFLVPVRDVDTTVDRMNRLASDFELRETMAGAAQKRAEEMSYQVYARGLLTALCKVVGESN